MRDLVRSRATGFSVAFSLLMVSMVGVGSVARGQSQGISPFVALKFSSGSAGGIYQAVSGDGNFVYQIDGWQPRQNFGSGVVAYRIDAAASNLSQIARYPVPAPSGSSSAPQVYNLVTDPTRNLLFVYYLVFSSSSSSGMIQVYTIGADGSLTAAGGAIPADFRGGINASTQLIIDPDRNRLFILSYLVQNQAACNTYTYAGIYSYSNVGAVSQTQPFTRIVSNGNVGSAVVHPTGSHLIASGFDSAEGSNCGAAQAKIVAYPVTTAGTFGAPVTTNIPSQGFTSPSQLSVHPGGKLLYLFFNSATPTLYSFDSTSGTAKSSTTSLPVVGSGLVFGADGRRAWGLNLSSGVQAYAVDPDNGSLTSKGVVVNGPNATDSAGSAPRLTLSSDGRRLLASNDNPIGTWVYGTQPRGLTAPTISGAVVSSTLDNGDDAAASGCTYQFSFTGDPVVSVLGTYDFATGKATGVLPIQSLATQKTQTFEVEAKETCGARELSSPSVAWAPILINWQYTVSGLASGKSVVVSRSTNDGALVESDRVDTNRESSAYSAYQGSRYSLTVTTQPQNQICTATPASGTVGQDAVVVQIACANLYTVGGSVSGLALGQRLTIFAGSTDAANQNKVTVVGDSTQSGNVQSFTLPQGLTNGSSYSLALGNATTFPGYGTSLPGLRCSFTRSGTGTIRDAAVTDVAVNCDNAFGFQIEGILPSTSATVTMTLNDANYSKSDIASDDAYTLTDAPPSSQPWTYRFVSASLSRGGASIAGPICASSASGGTQVSPMIRCTVNPFTATITGLNAGQSMALVLRSSSLANDQVAQSVSGSSYSFSSSAARVIGNTDFTLFIDTQPSGQKCTMTSDGGTSSASVNGKETITLKATAAGGVPLTISCINIR